MIGDLYYFGIIGKPITKKNSQRLITNKKTGRPIILPSKAFEEYQKFALTCVPDLNLDVPINVEAKFYMPTHAKVDLVNLQEALLDIMVKANCIKDDNSKIVVSMDGSRVMYDPLYPRVEVWIREVKE